ncbi:MAG TPA: methyltransferase dimerization domain-containing protein, partial [Armatimonadota bacterium]|nr:methyltransferase dimerization domain-containing protein [Armatimonadota bacterium]
MEKREPLIARALLEIGGAFQTSRPLLTAVELDLFTRLGDAKLTAAELAQAMGVDERALSYLLDALAAQRLLEKVSGAYKNTPEGRTLLVRDAPGSILAVLEHYANLWARWA